MMFWIAYFYLRLTIHWRHQLIVAGRHFSPSAGFSDSLAEVRRLRRDEWWRQEQGWDEAYYRTCGKTRA